MSSMIDGIGPLALLRGVDLNSTANTDIPMTIPNSGRKWTPLFAAVTNASANLSGGSAQFGIFTSTLEGGTAIVAKGVNSLTSLTSAAKMIKPTIASQTETLTAGTVYVHIDVANGSAATVDIYLYGYILP